MAATCACVVGGVTSCGGAPASGPPAAAVKAAVDTTSRSGSSRIDTTMTITLGGKTSVLHGQGVFDYRDGTGALVVHVPTAAGGTAELDELVTPEALYLTGGTLGLPAGRWARIDAAHLADGDLISSGATAPTTSFALLRGALGSVTQTGTGTVQGIPVRRFHGTIDLAQAVASGAPGAQAPLGTQLRSLVQQDAPFDAYLDDQGDIREIDETFVVDVPVSGGAPRQVTVVSSAQLYDFGVPVQFRLPASADVTEVAAAPTGLAPTGPVGAATGTTGAAAAPKN